MFVISPNQLFLSLETPGHINNSKKIQTCFGKYDLRKFHFLEINSMTVSGRAGVERNSWRLLLTILENTLGKYLLENGGGQNWA